MASKDNLTEIVQSIHLSQACNLKHFSEVAQPSSKLVALYALSLHFSPLTFQEALEQILRCIGAIVTLPEPALSLARFDYQSFRNKCRKLSLHNLERKSMGIYPLLNTSGKLPLYIPYRQAIESDILIGNAKWQHARMALTAWVQHTRFDLEEELSYQILLGSKHLTIDYREDKAANWNHLWGLLNSHYVELTTAPHRRLTTKVDPKQLLKQFKELIAQFTTSIDLCAFQLLHSLLSKSIDEPHLRHLSSSFFNFSHEYRGQNSVQNWLLISLYHKVSQFIGQAEIESITRSLFTERILTNAAKPQFYDYYMRVFMKDEDIERELNKLNTFPNYLGYHSDPNLIEKISINFLESNPQKAVQLLDKLPKRVITTKLMRLEAWRDWQFGREAIPVFRERKQEYIANIEAFAGKSQQIQQDYEQFLSSWQDYYAVLEGQDLKLMLKCLKRVSYPYHQHFAPLINNPWQGQPIYEVLIKYTHTLLATLQTLDNSGNKEIYLHVIHEDFFAAIMALLSEQQRNQFWSAWTSIFFQDESLLGDLLLK